MPAKVTTGQVWDELGKQMFGVLGWVTGKNESRTAGIVYVIQERKVYFATERRAWKTRHIERNPRVSMTVLVTRRIPLLPWINIPPATVTFSGRARVLNIDDAPAQVSKRLLHGLEGETELRKASMVIEVTPGGEFLTYGIAVPVRAMRNPIAAQGRVPVA